MSAATPRSNKDYRRPCNATTKVHTGRYDNLALNERFGAGITRATKAPGRQRIASYGVNVLRGAKENAAMVLPGLTCVAIAAPRGITVISVYLGYRRGNAAP